MTTESFTLLDFAPGATLEHHRDAPIPFAVWLDGDVIGAGATAEDAVADARRTVTEWAESDRKVMFITADRTLTNWDKAKAKL